MLELGILQNLVNPHFCCKTVFMYLQINRLLTLLLVSLSLSFTTNSSLYTD
jgi:hypothetical protein